MAAVAAIIPTDCTTREKSRATTRSTSNARVMTGKATAPPPRLVEPATKEPAAMIRDMKPLGMNSAHRSPSTMVSAQTVKTGR